MQSRRLPKLITLNALAEQFAQLSATEYDGVIIYDAGVVLNATPGAAALFGRDEGAWQRCPADDLFAPESRHRLRQHLGSILRGSCPAMAVQADGGLRPVEASVQASLTLEGRRVQIVALRDSTLDEARVYRTDRSIFRRKKVAFVSERN